MDAFNQNLDNQKNMLVKLYDFQNFREFKLFTKPLLTLAIFIPFGIYFLIKRFEQFDFQDRGLVAGLVCATVWMYLGQILIYKHFHYVYKKFWTRLYNLDDDKEAVVEVNKIIYKNYRRFDKFIFISWITIIMLSLVIGVNKLSIITISSIDDPMFIFLIIVSLVAGYFTSQGLSQTFKMIYSIKIVSERLNIPFDELNEDGLGNYTIIANYCFPTTLYLASGVLFIPILIEFMGNGSNDVNNLIILLIVLFSCFLLASMVYPLSRGYLMANISKIVALSKIKKDLFVELSRCLENPTVEGKIRWETLDYKLKSVESIPTYPFQLDTIVKIIVTTLIPILTFFVQLFLTEDVVVDFFKVFF